MQWEHVQVLLQFLQSSEMTATEMVALILRMNWLQAEAMFQQLR